MRNAECRLALNPETRERVFRLRYECYRRTGAIPPNVTGLFSDSYDELPNHFSFLLENESIAQATVRISVVRPELGWTAAPSRSVFGDHPAFPTSSYVEASRLCFADQARRGLLFRMLANLTALADHHQVEWLVACPRVEHAHLYKQLFGFAPLAEPRQYFGVNFATDLLAVRRTEIRGIADRCSSMDQAWRAALDGLVPCDAR